MPLFFRRALPRSPLNHGGWGKAFFMRIISAASWMKRRWLISVSIQSVRFCRPIGFSRSLCLCASTGASCSPFNFCLLTSSMMSCRYPIRRCPCPPPSWIHAPSSVYHAASFLCFPLCLSLRLSYRIASPRSPPRSSCRRAGRCRICGRDRLAFLVRAMWYRVGGGDRAACLMMSAMSM